VSADGPLPPGTSGPVMRWRVLRPMMLVHAAPTRESAVSAVAVADDLVWSCALVPPSQSDGDGGGWRRLADPDGWVAPLCPAGFAQLEEQSALHAGRPDREMEALDLWAQVRVAVLQTYGLAGRMALAVRFRGWEGEALELDEGASSRPAEWASVVERRQLAQKSPFAQGLLSVCHRDVVLEAQQQAIRTALTPAQCARRTSSCSMARCRPT